MMPILKEQVLVVTDGGKLKAVSFGEKLRLARDSRRWSREYLERVIRNRCKNGEHPVTAEAIRSIETGKTDEPRNGTRLMLSRIFPELA